MYSSSLQLAENVGSRWQNLKWFKCLELNHLNKKNVIQFFFVFFNSHVSKSEQWQQALLLWSSPFTCVLHEMQNADQLETQMRKRKQISKQRRDGEGEEKTESTLKVTEFSMPHITHIPFLLPFQLSNFINSQL